VIPVRDSIDRQNSGLLTFCQNIGSDIASQILAPRRRLTCEQPLLRGKSCNRTRSSATFLVRCAGADGERRGRAGEDAHSVLSRLAWARAPIGGAPRKRQEDATARMDALLRGAKLRPWRRRGLVWRYRRRRRIGRRQIVDLAGLAQRQCSGFVNRRSGVRIPHPASTRSTAQGLRWNKGGGQGRGRRMPGMPAFPEQLCRPPRSLPY
jgi:hypothetical protein